MTKPISIDIWSDIVCPWCYLGKHRFEAAAKEFARLPGAPALSVEYHSFQLAPDFPEGTSQSHGDYLAAKLGRPREEIEANDRRLQALGAQYGLVYDFPRSLIANTAKAHQLLHYAKAHGRQLETVELLFLAHFSEGAHIGDIDALADIAARAGLDRADALRALQAGDHAADVEQDKALAARYGIGGVPFFVVAGRYGLSGAQEPETFLKALEKIAAEGAEA